jgi:MFS family permease
VAPHVPGRGCRRVSEAAHRIGCRRQALPQGRVTPRNQTACPGLACPPEFGWQANVLKAAPVIAIDSSTSASTRVLAARKKSTVTKGYRVSNRRSTFAAASVSAIGSLPLHMMPILVVLAIQDNTLPVAKAGWISSAFMAGLLTGSVLLPALTVRPASRICVSSLLVVATIGMAHVFLQSADSVVFAWVLIGICCGGLHVVGALFAASSEDPRLVLRLRLGLVLLAASVAFAAGPTLNLLGSYTTAVLAMSAVFWLVFLGALPSYAAPAPIPTSDATKYPVVQGGWTALALLCVFFVGQPGFTAYAAHIANSNGVLLSQLSLIYATCKLIAGVSVLVRLRQGGSQWPLWQLSALLAAAVGLMYMATSLAAFAVALLAWELAVNEQSMRFQAAVLRRFPRVGGQWLSASIAFGAGVGPVIHGMLLASNCGVYFLAFSMVAAFTPPLWSGLVAASIKELRRIDASKSRASG